MTQIPESLLTLYSTRLVETDAGYLLPVPTEEVEKGALFPGGRYRVAIHPVDGDPKSVASVGKGEANEEELEQPIPVSEGERLELHIDTEGDRGDGMGHVGGYVVFVPGAKVGESVTVEVMEAHATYAIATLQE